MATMIDRLLGGFESHRPGMHRAGTCGVWTNGATGHSLPHHLATWSSNAMGDTPTLPALADAGSRSLIFRAVVAAPVAEPLFVRAVDRPCGPQRPRWGRPGAAGAPATRGRQDDAER
jgi:hypothetical protein